MREFASKFSLPSGTKGSFERMRRDTYELAHQATQDSLSSAAGFVNKCEAVRLPSSEQPPSELREQSGIVA